ncbi:MAG: manganese efflux pump, partial [Thermoplasmata archaeon]|nr:manganese efflux pump [Thermoplasmata archaeon]
MKVIEVILVIAIILMPFPISQSTIDFEKVKFSSIRISGIKEIISSFDHWIAFFILSAIGIKMIFEAEEFEMNAHSILILSIATSIDAFAIGITLSILNISIFFPALIIGLITFIIC